MVLQPAISLGLIWARQRKCLSLEEPCPHHRVSRAWRFPRCQAGPCEQDGTPLLEIDRALLSGPNDGCPKNSWAGLEEVDTERPPPALEVWIKRAEEFLERFEPIVRQLSKDDLQRAMLEMVDGGFPSELALKIFEAKGIDPDEELPEEEEEEFPDDNKPTRI